MEKNERSAFDAAVAYITYKDRTVKELSGRLREKGYNDFEIEETVEKLCDYGYLNDERYARSYISYNADKKGLRRIKSELKQKGIDCTVMSELSEDMDIDEIYAIEQMLTRRYEGIDLEDERERRRLYAFFSRRGFAYENINKAVINHKK